MLNEKVQALTQINIKDFLEAWGLGRAKRGRRLLEWLATPPARRFAHQVAAYDDHVGADGLQAGAAWTIKRFAARLEAQSIMPSCLSTKIFCDINHS